MREDAAVTELIAVLTPHLRSGEVSSLLCDRGAALPLAADMSARFGETTFAGPARTVATPTGSLVPIRRALADLPNGAVLAIDASAFDGAVWGGRLAARARARGAVGVVVLGRVRDVNALSHESPGVVALGTAPHRSDASDAGETDVVLRVAGRRVAPGDLLISDSNGVVAVAPEAFETVRTHIDDWVAQDRAADEEARS